ncbi:hypothetical protein GE061_017670 [Apolygus lucorum]|uniref:Aminopeptidase n=1 Tax=Apolygus lucorum TaxID=248454 RepID=A0A8S9XBP2_APOLU|nr:hypothetical protein GE061_017670 [Apolygus lucorum]
MVLGLAVAAVLVVSASGFYELPKTPLEPRGYRIDLHPHIEDNTYKGRVRIDIVNRGAEAVTEIRLDASSNLTIIKKDVQLMRLANADLSEEESDEEETVVKAASVDVIGEEIVIQATSKLLRDATYQVDIPFEGKLGTDLSSPFFKSTYTDVETAETRWFVVLSPKIDQAHHVFPCFDKSFLKSWFELSVVRKRSHSSLSNMPVLDSSNETSKGDMVRDQFSRTPLMTVNSLGLFISDFKTPEMTEEYMQSDGIKIGLWGRSDFVSTLFKAQQLLPSVLVSLELYLSRPYPLPHLNLIALPGYTEDRPRNSWGLQWFKESDLMNTNSYWLTHRVAKAAAMQWLSHLATPVNDSVVTAGLANFLATNVAQQLEPTMYHWNLGSFHTLVLELGKPRNYGLDSEQKRALLESRVHLVIQMLEQVFGTFTFKQAIQNFLAKKEFKAYADDDLWQVITEQAWVDKKLSASISLSEVIPPWLKDRIPLVTVSTTPGNKTTIFTQDRYIDNLENTWNKVVKKENPEKAMGWWLPLVVSEEQKEPKAVGWMKPSDHTVSLTNISITNYIIVNPGSTGPYMVNYDAEMWKKLAAEMKSLPVTHRAQLLHDSLSLALSGHLMTVTALEITASLKTEQAPEVWRTFYPLAERLRDRFQGTSASHNLDAYLKGLLIPVLDALGEEDKSSWKTELRVRTRHLLCQTGFSPCIENARSFYALWQNASHPDEGMPIATSHLCPVMAWGNYDEWQFALERLKQFPTNRSKAERTFLMKTVSGCPHDPKKYEMLLNLTFMNRKNNVFSDEDRYIVLSAIAGESIGYTSLFNFLKSNWNDLKKRTEEGLKEVTALYNERKSEMGTAMKAAEDSLSRVEARVKWAKESTPSVESWLNKTMEASWTPQRFKFQDVVVVTHARKTV